jgi:Protein of unknown function (DUF1761)
MDVQVNFVGVLAGAIVSMMVGGFWYSKAGFGKDWVRLEHIDEKKAADWAPKALAGMFGLALVMAYIVAHVSYLSFQFFDNSFQSAALSSAFWLWLGLVLPVTASNSLFNQKPWKISMIHAGNWLVTLLGMGLVIGLIGV